MKYKSQIRDSTINDLTNRVASKRYEKYLFKINLRNVRGIVDQAISFDFPVTALIGPNGGGKTTILGAAATAFASIKPRQFFTKSGRLDESMTDWRIEYELIDRTVNRNDVIRRTAAFHKSKWSRTAESRNVLVFGVLRTVPASERREAQRFASGKFEVNESLVEQIQTPVAEAVKKILGKDIARYERVQIDRQGRVSLLKGETESGVGYSEFHFGAGESSVIRMVMAIESSTDGSLILIEEIENGLHPVATIRLVEYLIEAAERKGTQTVFTTHSNDALRPLPPAAIWASVNGQLMQGKLDVAALRVISGQIEAQLAIFTEDRFAASWLTAILRSRGDVPLDAIEIHPLQGDGAAVVANRYHNRDPSMRFPSACVLDGDSSQVDKPTQNVFRLPGGMPEAYVFDRVLEAPSEVGRLTVRLQQDFRQQDELIQKLRCVRDTNRDAHVIFSQVAEQLGFLPVQVVEEAFFATWVEAYPSEAEALLAQLRPLIPIASHSTTSTGGGERDVTDEATGESDGA